MFYSAMTDLLIDMLTKFFKKSCIFEEQLYSLKLKKTITNYFFELFKGRKHKANRTY